MGIDAEYIKKTWGLLFPATIDTLYMVFVSSLFSVVIGLLLGIVLYSTDKDCVFENSIVNKILGSIINVGRSIPFVILVIAVFPLSKFIVGTTIGKTAAIVPLTIAAIPFVARITEGAFKEVDRGIVEAAITMGASRMQVILKVVIPETLSTIIMGITITIINIIGYSAMAGTIGGGGLGDVAIRYGHQSFRFDLLFYTIIILVVIVQIVQGMGSFFASLLNHK